MAGHLIIDLRLRAGRHRAGTVAERLDGIGQLAALRALGQRPPKSIAAELRILHRRVLTSAQPVNALGATDPEGIALLASLPELLGLTGESDSGSQGALQPEAEAVGFPVESGVNTARLASNLYGLGHMRTGTTAGLTKALQTRLLWDSICVADGTLCRQDTETGAISFIAARDPHILRKIDVFLSAPDCLRMYADGNMIEQCIAGAVREATRPVLAGQTETVCVERHLQGITDARRQAERDELLTTNRRDALNLSDVL